MNLRTESGLKKIFTRFLTLRVYLPAVFLTHLIAGLFLQLIMLPYFVPSMNAGHGLVKGMDSIYFHSIALELLEKMNQHGWTAWELRPNSNAPAGIAAAIYKLTIPEPWVLLPFNALVQALSAFFFYGILVTTRIEAKLALLLTIPFAFFPSSFLWTTQIHKDGLFILGLAMWFFVWSGVTAENKDSLLRNVLRFTIGSVFLFVSFALVFMVRSYFLDVMLVLQVVLLIGIFAVGLKKSLSYKARLYLVSIGYFVFTVFLVESSKLYNPGLFHEPILKDLAPAQTPTQPMDGDLDGHGDGAPASPFPQTAWKNSEWLPDNVNAKLRQIAKRRESTLKYNQGVAALTNIDHAVDFQSPMDILLYLPRAVWVGLLTPFPNQWFQSGTAKISLIMRWWAGIEMMYFYAILIGFLVTIRTITITRLQTVLCLVSLLAMVIFVLVMNNSGTLYRLRFLFIHLIIAVLAGAFFSSRSKKLI